MASRLQQIITPEKPIIPAATTGSRLNLLLGKEVLPMKKETFLERTFPSTKEILEEFKMDPLSLRENPKEAISSAWNSLKESVAQSAPKISKLFTEEKAKEISSKELGKELEAVSAFGHIVFAPISALFEGMNKVPVLGSVSRLISLPFVAGGEAASGISGEIVDELPIPDKDKENIKQGIQEISALATQLVIGKITHIGTKKVKELKTKFGEKDAQMIVNKAQEFAEQAKEPVPETVSAPTIAPEAQKGVAGALKAEKGIIPKRTIMIATPDEMTYLKIEVRKETPTRWIDTDGTTFLKNKYKFVREIKPEAKPIPEELGISAREAREWGAQIKGDKVVLYHGSNNPNITLKNLQEGSFLSSVAKGKDITGNEGAAAYGKYVKRFEIPFKDVRVNSTGEFQYIGKTTQFKGGKFPEKFYREYNEYFGSNLTRTQIEAQTDILDVARALSGYNEAKVKQLVGADFYAQAIKGIKGVKPVAPKIELPKVILPTLKAPKGLEITARRATEINKVGISPEEFIPALEARKRGTIPFKEMTERAVKLNKDLDDLLKIKPGTIKEPIEVERFRLVRNGLQKDVEKLRQNYVANPTSKNKAMLDEAQGRLNQAYVKIEGIRSEYGRGLSATRIDSELDIAAKNLNEIRLKLEPEKQLIFDKRLEALNINNPSEVVRFITEFRKAGIVEKVLEWWKAMLLSAPITHIRNFTGNTLFVLFDIPVKAFAGGLDAVRSVFGRPRTVYAGESLRMVYNGLKALPDATTEAIRAMRDEFYQYGARRMTIEAGMRTPAIKGLTGRIVRIPYRALSAMDLFSRKIKLTMETDALAYRMAKQKGFKGAKLVEEIEKIKRAPPIELINLATKKADRALFLEEMTGVLKSLEGMKNRHPTMQFIIPFYRTPVNLAREAYRLTPLRFMGKAKNFDPWLLNQSTQMEEISRTILGSLIGGTIVWKMVDGSIDITGTAPRGTNERALFYRQGKQPYSVRIGDNWYSYREIHPFATIMFGAAQIGEAIKLYQEKGEITDKEVEDRINRLITDTSLYIQDLTFFQGLGNFVEAISGGSYNQGLTSIGPNYLGQLLGGFIPNLLYSYQRAADPTIYSTKGFEEQIKKRIPGMAESLISKRDIYGQPLERPGTFWQRFLSPVQVSQEKRDLVDMEMEKLEIAVGYPGRTAFGEPLTDFEWDAYLQDSGARLYEGLHDLMISEDYETMTNYEKQKEIEYVVRISREDSRYSLFENKKDIADYKKGLLEKGYNEAEAEEMAEKEFGIELAKKELYKPKIRPGIMPIKAPRERILFSGE